METSERVPVISLDEHRRDHARLHAVIGGALERIGFVIVTDHGIPANLLEAAYAASAQVFDLPLEVKLRYERLPDHQVGYTPFGVEHAKDRPDRPDLKEFWHVRNTDDGLPVEVPRFGEVCRYLSRQLGHLGNQILDHVGAYLGKPPGFFREWTRDGRSLTRILHYPEIDAGARGLRSSEHEDINLITLLPASTAPGLEVQTRDGEWIPIDNPPESIVVNAGDMLDMHTGGRIRSATHRVVNLPGRRFSIPHFVHPRSEIVLQEEPRVTAGEYLHQRLIEIGVIKT
ncbi:MAG TPA: 2-oxoglutarate and iron-dependent oxygenase domain-containing protein [Candidatus Baltobacteraceae bacterium]|nr:2-oxoglutarate and iron-dependent oxygenase domain-containing protein [Candidatus Baltobacteraceae bacterium]